MHEHIVDFYPDVTSLERAHQDFFMELEQFNAGNEFENFNIFLLDEAEEYKAMYLALKEVHMNYDD